MDKEVAQAIASVAEVADADLELREDYRTSWGGTTAGLVCGNLGIFVQCVALAVKHADDDMQDRIAVAMSGLRQDSMGRSVIFY